jgi:putative Mg2+ transporter-C (MgtC) family protein
LSSAALIIVRSLKVDIGLKRPVQHHVVPSHCRVMATSYIDRSNRHIGLRFISELALDKLQIGTHFLALAAAFALAIPIGWDREKRARSAGLRTFPLVALASCGFVQASENLLVHSPDGMAKVIEGLITGIGFIGGGAILKQGNSVQGTATAASLWATGAIGVSVGLGSFDVAITVAVFTFLTLKLLTLVKEDIEPNDIKPD